MMRFVFIPEDDQSQGFGRSSDFPHLLRLPGTDQWHLQQDPAQTGGGSQQRVLSRIYTGFPFNSGDCSSGNRKHAKLNQKAATWPISVDLFQ